MAYISPFAHRKDLQVHLLDARMGRVEKFSMFDFLNLKLLPFGMEISLIWDTVLCILESLVVSLASTCQLPVAAPSSHPTTVTAKTVPKYHQMFPGGGGNKLSCNLLL